MTDPEQIQEWYTLDTLTFMDLDLFDADSRTAHADLKVFIGLTHSAESVEVVYHATGDYEDHFVDVTGRQRDIICWRPVQDL
jgi:hypothetical protein